MLDAKRMEQFKENGADAALKLRGEMVAALQDRITGTMRAINSYFNDKQTKAAAITDRIEEMREQKAELEEQVGGYGQRLANATLSGDSADLKTIQEEITSLEAQKSALDAQIGLLGSISIAGDESLFTEADKQARDLAAFWTATQADLSALSALASEQMNAWSQVARVSGLGGDILPRNAVFSRVDEMRKDFHEKEGANNE